MIDTKEFLDALTEIQKDLMISRNDMAKEIGITPDTLSRLYNNKGRASYKTLRKIREYINSRTFIQSMKKIHGVRTVVKFRNVNDK